MVRRNPMAASSGSSTSSQPAGGRPRTRKPIPSPAPLEHECEDECECKLKMAMFISWTDDNPGKRFLRCQIKSLTSARGCDKFKWEDPEWTDFQLALVLGLRDAVFALQDENSTLREEKRALRKQLDEAPQRVREAAADEVAGNPAHKAKTKDSGHNLLMIWVFSVLFAMYFGMTMSSS